MKERYMNTGFITHKDSTILYGIAIILMVFHHCFCIPSRLNYNYIPVIFNIETLARLAYIGKLCVAFYAFISRYAFAKKHYTSTELFSRFKECVIISVTKLLKFYSTFWFVWVIFIPLGIQFFDKPSNISSILKSLFLGEGYNGEWWYVKQYLLFLIVFPFLESFLLFLNSFDKKRISYYFGVICISLILMHGIGIPIVFLITKLVRRIMNSYMIIFLIAYLIGKNNIYEYIDNNVQIPNLFYHVFIIMMIFLRWVLVRAPAESKLDIIISPIVIFSIVKLLHTIKKDNKILKLIDIFGRYSTIIWLSHTFWIYYYFQNIILLPKYSILIFIWALVICLLNAIVLDYLFRKIKLLA